MGNFELIDNNSEICSLGGACCNWVGRQGMPLSKVAAEYSLNNLMLILLPGQFFHLVVMSFKCMHAYDNHLPFLYLY
jgi:hypothetical protein